MPNTGMLVSMKPTSISYSGTSASINDNGGVDFTAVTSLSLNGVFTGDYDNYLIVAAGASSNVDIVFRLRVSGSDASGSNYTRQYLQADGGSATGARLTSQTSMTFFFGGSNAGETMHLYGPFLAQPTAARTVNASSLRDGLIFDVAQTHSLSTSYDGFTLSVGSGSLTGTVHVFGYRE